MSAAESIEAFDYLLPEDGAATTDIDRSLLLAQPLAGLTVLVTGEVPGLSRAEAQAAVARLGGAPVGSVSRSTGLVVVGEGAGVSKMAKARSFGLVGLLGAEFAALAERPERWHPARLRRVAVLDDLLDPQPATSLDSAVHGDPGEPSAAPPEGVADVAVWPLHLVGQTVVWPDGVREVRRSCFCGHRWLTGSISERLVCPRDGEPFGEDVDLERLGRKPAGAASSKPTPDTPSTLDDVYASG